KLLPTDLHGKYYVLQWVYWQIGGLGPIAGQAHHFLRYATQKVESPMRRVTASTTCWSGCIGRSVAWDRSPDRHTTFSAMHPRRSNTRCIASAAKWQDSTQ